MTEKLRNPVDIFRERGLYKQCTDEEKLKVLFATTKVTAYIGFDPTAPSLHAGGMIPVMALKHLQLAGHRPIAVVGGGTGLVGDPSGKTEQRQVLTKELLTANYTAIRRQLGRFLDFEGGGAIAENNADWIEGLNYIDFLREIGRHFSVNKMLSFEAYKLRMEKGLSFLEFNYQLLQAYDFLMLYRKHGCVLQMGGDDQWGNIVAGTDLVRRVEGADVHGLTFPLLQTASGAKMGKTAKGAVWLDPELCTPYEYYQYWVNTDDRDVPTFLGLFTLLPITEVNRLSVLQGAEIREAKRILAFEATAFCHGMEAAKRAQEGAIAAFCGGEGVASIPSLTVKKARIIEGIRTNELFVELGLCSSKRQAVDLFRAGGGSVGERIIKDHNDKILMGDFSGGEVLLRAGKKRRHRLVLAD